MSIVSHDELLKCPQVMNDFENLKFKYKILYKITQKCCLFFILATAAPTCPEPFGEQAYAHPENCDQFFLCTNGTLTLETCENGLLFDGKGAVHNHCNYNWAVECGERKHDREYDYDILTGDLKVLGARPLVFD